MKIIIITTLLSLSSLLLASCGPDTQELQNTREQAIKDAVNIDPHVHRDYLQCYALNFDDKRACINELSKYVPLEFKHNSNYTNHFRLKAEKLGFTKFINDHGQPCPYLERGPEFIPAIKGYLAICTDDKAYFLKFYPDEKKWVLVK